MKQKPRIKQITELAKSRLFTIEQLDLEFSNGAEAQFERIVANAGRAVMVAAVTKDNEILLVREYAAGLDRYELQLPKGIVEDDENSTLAANRELSEETGYAARQLTLLKTLRVSPGYFKHKTDLVMAKDLYENKLEEGDEPEELDVIKYPLAEADALLSREDFSEARSIAGVMLVMKELGIR
jgi:ADP-ribose diphosphatase